MVDPESGEVACENREIPGGGHCPEKSQRGEGEHIAVSLLDLLLIIMSIVPQLMHLQLLHTLGCIILNTEGMMVYHTLYRACESGLSDGESEF